MSRPNDARGSRGPEYSEAEINILLNLVEEILPFGGNQWDMVSMRFSQMFPNSHRDAESLKAKFKRLKNYPKGTGEPTCPPSVVRAKRLYHQIEARMAVADMDDDQRNSELPSNTISHPVASVSSTVEPYTQNVDEVNSISSATVNITSTQGVGQGGGETLPSQLTGTPDVLTSQESVPSQSSQVSTPAGNIAGLVQGRLRTIQATSAPATPRQPTVTSRVGLNVQQLQNLSSLVTTGRNSPLEPIVNDTTATRRNLDRTIAAIGNSLQSANNQQENRIDPFLVMYMQHMQDAEERRELRELNRQRTEREQEERRIRIEQETQERRMKADEEREERRRRLDEESSIRVMTMFHSIFNRNDK